LKKRGLKGKGYILATIHRAENTDDSRRLGSILQAFREIAGSVPVVLPLHPRTRAILGQKHLQRLTRELILIEPVGYLDMVVLEKNASLIATDSGGVQKEAFFHRVPCLTLREETEWVELVQLGWNTLVPPNSSREIVAGIRKALKGRRKPSVVPTGLYGGGKAGRRILEILRRSFFLDSTQRAIPA
jgi:UDP-GlcNAc3NAcA epimerase